MTHKKDVNKKISCDDPLETCHVSEANFFVDFGLRCDILEQLAEMDDFNMIVSVFSCSEFVTDV